MIWLFIWILSKLFPPRLPRPIEGYRHSEGFFHDNSDHSRVYRPIP